MLYCIRNYVEPFKINYQESCFQFLASGLEVLILVFGLDKFG